MEKINSKAHSFRNRLQAGLRHRTVSGMLPCEINLGTLTAGWLDFQQAFRAVLALSVRRQVESPGEGAGGHNLPQENGKEDFSWT